MTAIRPGERKTIEDVAREADVSYATVSRVINSKGYVSEETRERVLAAVERTGYVVNRQAQGLARGRSQVVSLVVPGLDSSYIGEIVRGIDEVLAAVSYDLMLYTTHHRKHRESAFVATVTAGLSDGLLLVLPSDPGAYLESFRRHAFPCVLIDHRGFDEGGPSVGATNHQGGYEATSYALREQVRIGALRQGQAMVYDIDFSRYRDYVLVANCDADCGDVDLVLTEPDGREVVSDRAFDDQAVLLVPASHKGDHKLRVSMANCGPRPLPLRPGRLHQVTPMADPGCRDFAPRARGTAAARSDEAAALPRSPPAREVTEEGAPPPLPLEPDPPGPIPTLLPAGS